MEFTMTGYYKHGSDNTNHSRYWNVPEAPKIEGRKEDNNKLRYDLISPYGLEELALVYTEGAKKYDDRNWENGIPWCRIFAAMMRHAWAWFRGSVRHERGMHHLASVAWCAFALMEYEITHPELDDRPKRKEPTCRTVGFTKTVPIS